jgi:hypothetical protein
MYFELDSYLLGYLPFDYWYDEGYSIAKKMLSMFSQKDWKDMLENILSKTLDYQRKLAYCIENSGNEHELSILLLLTSIEDKELFEICVDSLREFISSDNYTLVMENDTFINRINMSIKNASEPVKKVYEDFLRKLEALHQ